MAYRRKAVKGGAALRRLFKQLPDAAREEIVQVLDLGGRTLEQEQKARAPFRTGQTKRALAYKVLPQTLRLRVGLIGSNVPFYGRIQDLGRKAKIVKVERRRRVEGVLRTFRRRKIKGDIVTTYTMRVRAMRGRKFVTGSFAQARRTLNNRLKLVWGRVLARAGSGSGGGPA